MNTNKTKRPTMKDVAQAAKVSQSTVSFVLNGQDEMRIGEETRHRVLDAIEKLGYMPRSAGRPKKSPVVRCYGLMIDEIATSPFGAITVQAVQEAAWERGIVLSICMSGGSAEYENIVLRRWKAEQIDGVIYASILTRHIQPPEALSDHRAVLLNCYCENFSMASVTPAERRGGYSATQKLIEAGYERIAFIRGEHWMDASHQREEGYVRALQEAGRAVIPELMVSGNFLPDGGREATIELLELANRPDAIFCANDLMALGAYEACKERGLKIPQDIAIMGYDDQEIAQQLHPLLSTVNLPHAEMGVWCVEHLDAQVEPVQHRMECELVIRNSI